MAKKAKKAALVPAAEAEYGGLLSGISELLEQARRSAVRAVNGILTAAYWEIGRRVVEFEQGGQERAGYGEELLKRLGQDLTAKHGRGFSERSLLKMRTFYLGWEIWQTPSAKLQARAKCPASSDTSGSAIPPTVSAELQTIPSIQLPFDVTTALAEVFPLPWSHYVRLMAVKDVHARSFYETEAVRGAWSVRQLDRQINTQFYERTALSKRKLAMLEKGQIPLPGDAVSVRDAIRDPYLLEFLDLKDEYSETDLEEALIRHLESFLLELGEGFTFVARQKRIRVGDSWYRIDLLLYHRDLRCLVIIDLKTGEFTHADAGQMNLYLNFAREHLTRPSESDPVGLILCSEKDDAVVRYATGGIQAQVFASKYLKALPDPETLRQEIRNTQQALTTRAALMGRPRP
jgi:predicted nuclease of restriction endonuclease-like (RecB) superfamily